MSAPQIIYDQNGNLQGAQQLNADGSATFIPFNGNGWAAYVGANGMPALTGTPSYPPTPLTQNQQNAIAALKAYAQTTLGAQTGISAQQDAFNREVLVVLRLIGSQLN